MKKFIIQSIALILVTFVGLALFTGGIPELGFGPQKPKITQVQINDLNLKVELADTTEKRKKGLGGRENLTTDSGMLFIFSKAHYYNFWMKGVSFPLDFIWIREGKVVDITKNAPPKATGQRDEELSVYTPIEAVDSVLEVNGGFVDAHGIKIGDGISVKR